MSPITRAAMALILVNSPSFGQSHFPFEFGVHVGKPLSTALEIEFSQYVGLQGILYSTMKTPPLVIGPMLGYNLKPYLTVQFEALHKSVRYDEATRLLVFSDVVDTSQTTVKGSWWEYPLTAKVRLLKGHLQPFAIGGISFSSTSLSQKAVYTRTSSAFPDQNRSATLSSKVVLNTNAKNVAFVMGVGLGFPFRHFLIGPELRYSRWGSARPYPGWYPTVNQTDLLVGITFRP